MDDFNDIKQQNQTRRWSGTNKYHTLPLQKKWLISLICVYWIYGYFFSPHLPHVMLYFSLIPYLPVLSTPLSYMYVMYGQVDGLHFTSNYTLYNLLCDK